MAHTPAPWAVFQDHPDEETAKSLAYIRPAHDAKNFYQRDIALVFGCDTEEYQAANAKLIAAAPDLLAALIEARDALNGAPNTVGLHNQINAAIEKCRH